MINVLNINHYVQKINIQYPIIFSCNGKSFWEGLTNVEITNLQFEGNKVIGEIRQESLP